MIILDIPAGGIADDIGSMQTVLQQVYTTMMVHSGELIGVGQAIGGIAALWFIGVRVWRHIARAEPVDVYPLLRPFAIGGMILMFPAVLGVINAVMEPTVTGTSALVKDGNQAVATLLGQRQLAIQQSSDWQMYVGPDGGGDLDKWEALSGESDSSLFSGVSNRLKFEMAKVAYNKKNSVKLSFSQVLEILFESAALCINVVRLFFLIVLSIFGPLAFGLSLFDGLRHTLDNWLAKYINVYLWLPVANIFGSIISQIQEEMIKMDIAQLGSTGQSVFGATDTAYMIFLVMGIAGYFTVPSITNYIVRAGSSGARQFYSIIQKAIYHV